MAENNNEAIYWLILVTSISSMTSGLLYWFQRCCGNCWGNIGNVCYQTFAPSLEIREETLDRVTNLYTIPRILQQLGLQTFKVIWNHDANAQAGDCVQYGWLRLPTKSYVLAFLSVCGVTHYVYIHFNLNQIEIVGPTPAIGALIDMSNLAATAALEPEQVETLRQAFGMGDALTTADKVCTLWERLFFVLLIVFVLWLGCALQFRLVFFIVLMFGIVNLAIVVRCKAYCITFWNKADKKCKLLTCFQLLRHRPMAIDDLELAALIGTRDLDDVPPITGTGDVDSIEATQLTADNISDTVPPITVAVSEAELDHGRSHIVVGQSHNVFYSVLQARNNFFEVVKQTEVIPQPAPIVSFAEEARMYAIKTQPNFVHYLAQRTVIPENALLHICNYNPLIDPYLTEIYQNFQKGVGRENLLLIIFPPLAHFNACFQT